MPTDSSPRAARRDAGWLRATLDRLRVRACPDDEPFTLALQDEPEPSEHELCEHVSALIDVLGLTEVEGDLLLVVLALTTTTPAAGLLDRVKAPSGPGLLRLYAEALGCSVDALGAALRPAGVLRTCAAVRLERDDGATTLALSPYANLVQALSEGLRGGDPLEALFPTLPPPTLALADYDHLQPLVGATVRLLRRALAERTPGVNILLVGPPGTGKTQLARLLAREAGARGYQVRARDADGEVWIGMHRMSSWHTGQLMLARDRSAVLVFDEAEDAFLAYASDTDAEDRESKAGLNEALEAATVPTLWIANSVEDVDPAYLRRFLVHLRVPVPPLATRRRLVDHALTPFGVDARTARRLAREPGLTPAQVDRVSRVLGLVRPDDAAEATALATALLVGEAPGEEGEPPFDPRLFEADADARALAERLATLGSGRVLLHGPPGTGKSAFAGYVAACCGRPLVRARPSDLLGPLVGQTEQQLAAAFAAARDDGAVLVLDEVDGLFAGRRTDDQAWRLTQVGQALTELERFEGVFIGTTNLLSAVDHAFLRRFDVVLEVGPPGPVRRRTLLLELCEEFGLSAPDDAMVRGLDGLTPGHVAQARRRWRLTGEPSSTPALVTELARLVRPLARRPVGFGVAAGPTA